MNLKEKRDKKEAHINALSNDIEKRTADVRKFIDETLSKVPTDWPYPGGWSTWLLKRLEGIEAANNLLLDRYKERDYLDKEIIKRKEQEEEAARYAEKYRIAEENRIAAEKAAEQAAIEIAEENARAAKAAAEENARAAKAAEEAAIKAEKIAKLNDFLNKAEGTRKNKLNALQELYKMGGISKEEFLIKTQLITGTDSPL